MSVEDNPIIAKLKFGGLVEKVAKGFGGSFRGDYDYDWKDRLYQEYLSLDPAPNKKKWLTEKIAPVFKYVDKPPKWLYSDPEWPFHNGEPMLFLNQFSVKDDLRIRGITTVDVEVYVFGALEPVPELPGRLQQVYKVVEQLQDFVGFN